VRRVVLRASAKVNLALEVLGKRADGYHEIATVMHAVDLTDRIVLEDADAVALTTTARELPTGGENLCVRAARLLQESVGVERGVHIALDKRIPVGAGLGGGSSDAAAMLLGLTRLWRLRLGRERLHAAAVKLGMDVPFFLGAGRTLATGRGERLRALPAGGGYALVLVNPQFPLSTAEVYGRVGPAVFTDGARTRAMVEALRRRSATAVAQALYNGLEVAVESAYPVIRRMKAALLGAGALGAVMSGSGPTVFGVARSLDHARQVRNRVARASWACWSVRTVSGAPVRIEGGTGRGDSRWGVAKR
jgi:4-diphosphocytidyl-2-C-methyl-D-erythritol kinase